MTRSFAPSDAIDQTCCALPGCYEQLPTPGPGQPSRRYCSSEHRAADRARSPQHAGSTGPATHSIPTARHPQQPTPTPPKPAAASAGEPSLAELAGQAAAILVRRQHASTARRNRVRVLTMVAVAGLLIGGVVWMPRMTADEPAPATIPTVDTVTEDQWAEQVKATITALRTQSDELTRVQLEWNTQPARLRSPQPPPVDAVQTRLTVVTQQRVLLESQLESATALHTLGVELNATIQTGATLDTVIAQAPDPDDSTPEQAADLQRLWQQRHTIAARQTSKQAQLDQLRAEVRASMRAPLPDPTPNITHTLLAEVRDYITHPERPRTPEQPATTEALPQRHATEPRENLSPSRRDVHAGAPPRPGKETEPEHSNDGRRPSAPQTGTSNPGNPTHAGTYQVRPGDSLWKIADAQLGDPERWREIFQLNRGRAQADGTRLTDPSLIRVGWTLRLPATNTPDHRTQGEGR